MSGSQKEASKQTFRSHDGGVLNWWESTGTIQFQGKAIARTVLEQAFKNAMAKHAVTPKMGSDEEDDYYDEESDDESDDYDNEFDNDDIELDDDDREAPVPISSIPKVGGDTLLNLVKKALVEYGFDVSLMGPSTFLFKGTGGTPSFILAQDGQVIRIWK